MDDLRKRFGRLVAANRRHRSLSQAELAEGAGISVAMINRIERGVSGARFNTIDSIANALGVDPAELFTAELPGSVSRTRSHTSLFAKLAPLSEPDIEWIGPIIDAALKSRR